MYLEAHIIQSVPFSNLNRDGLGSPKTATVGGAARYRVSSQAWKRPVRKAVEQALGEPTLRTRQIARAVTKRLAETDGWDNETARKAGRAVMHAAGIGVDKKTDDSVLAWVPTSVVAELAALCQPHQADIAATELPLLDETGKPVPEKNQPATVKDPPEILQAQQVQQLLSRRAPTINLLGRFLAELPGATIDGSVTVSHPVTTHKSVPDFDFFTAVDDRVDQSTDSGAGHLSTAEFAAGTFYRYTSVNLNDLAQKIGTVDDAAQLAETYLQAFVAEMPQGKQRVADAHSLPDLVVITGRDKRPVNLASAFEEPVRPDPQHGGGFRSRSAAALDAHASRVHTVFGAPAFLGHVHTLPTEPSGLGQDYGTIDALLQAAADHVSHTLEPEPNREGEPA